MTENRKMTVWETNQASHMSKKKRITKKVSRESKMKFHSFLMHLCVLLLSRYLGAAGIS